MRSTIASLSSRLSRFGKNFITRGSALSSAKGSRSLGCQLRNRRRSVSNTNQTYHQAPPKLRMQREDDRDVGVDFDRLAVEQRRRVSPLAHRFDRRARQIGIYIGVDD